ncbi:nuclease A inhibitor family protein [Hydrocoleum sp. CS-953]|uniref:nuclease A inhibitor family protein n=1 Tax=Microcoleaceae TaxID=1892252 RepID=UPI000B9B17FE|nr:nuclease A inhibitor family protein [Hydrocoleum sp. CS-953]OZH54480.1 nuclease [Hydrocoleum sp. CS-953]
MNLTNLEIFEQLHEAVKGLLWMSESDYTFEALIWEFGEKISLDNEVVLKITKHSLDTPVKVIEFDSFFQWAITPKNWHNSEDADTVNRYQELVRIMKQYLSDLKVYKVGEIEIDVYIIGKTDVGDYAGLATVSIET